VIDGLYMVFLLQSRFISLDIHILDRFLFFLRILMHSTSYIATETVKGFEKWREIKIQVLRNVTLRLLSNKGGFY